MALVQLLTAVWIAVAVCLSGACDRPNVRTEQSMATFNVTNATELAAALAKAQGGDRIILAPGHYGDLKLSKRVFSSPVEIVSLDAAQPADFRSVTLSSVTNLSFKSVEIGYALTAGESTSAKMVTISSSSFISFDSVHFRGSLDNNPWNDGHGLSVLNSKNLRVVNSEFQQLNRAALFGSSSNIEVSNNKFHDLRSDGVDFADAQNVRITGNHFTDFYPVAGDHPDAIQFWTRGTTKPSTDILIRDNVIIQGKGAGIQGIFLSDNAGLPFERVSITNNLVYVQDGHNGIAIFNGRDIAVEGNTVLSPNNDKYKLYIRLEGVTGGSVAGNVSDTIINERNSNLSLSDNLRLDQSPGRATEFSDLNSGPTATVGGLVTPSIGYQPSATAAPTQAARWGTAGNDGWYLGATLNPTLVIDGLGGTDQIAIQGHHGNLVLGPENLLNVEILVLLAGNDTRFGDTSNSHYSYNITTVDANVAAGRTLIFSSNQLRAGENFTLDGSAETDGAFIVYAGRGDDRLIGGASNDGFFFGDGAFTPADRIDGGAGNDQVAFRGNYGALLFADDTIRNVESLALVSGSNTRFGPAASGYHYDITLGDGNVAAGARLIVTGVELLANESMRIDGSAETNGYFRLLAGKGDDILIGGACGDFFYGNLGADHMTGGGGADIFHYRTAPESTGLAFDSIIGFDCREDRIDLPVDLAGFSDIVMGGRLSAATVEADLDAALDGLLGAGEAALFTPNAGDMAGRMFVVVDVDGVAGYKAGKDLLIELVSPAVPLPESVDIFI